jgi:cupin fold WbuC family metalloprotein
MKREQMIKITDKLMDLVSSKSKTSIRKRYNYNFHNSNSDYLQRFLNAAEPDTYVRPHKHETPGKVEIFLILKGRVLVIEFDDDGKITDHIILDSEKGNIGVEIAPGIWHSFIVLKESSILYEIKQGPYIMETDKIFAEWAPEEGTKESQEFNDKVLLDLS